MAATTTPPTAPAVIVCTPNYTGTFPVEHVTALLETMAKLPAAGVRVRWLPRCGDALLSMARNWLAAEALADPVCTHLLWVDADIAWDAADVLRLLRHDLVAATYRRKCPQVEFDVEALPGATTDPTTGLLEVDTVGFGFVLLRRRVLLRLIEAYPESRIRKGHGIYPGDERALPWLHDFFPLGFQGDAYTSEDFAFCRRWRAIGGKVWVDLGIQLTHFTIIGLEADPMAELGRSERSSFGGKAA